MKVLIACECSGRVRDAFLAKGYEAVSCDLVPSETPGPHIQGDVIDILNDGWEMMIGHPPCTRLCNSGVRWLAERNLWKEMEEGARFFNLLKDACIPRIALENPVPHHYARDLIGDYDQKIQPWQFGDGAIKATCLWLKGLPPLIPTHAEYPFFAAKAPQERRAECHLESPGPDRSKNRARTYPGIADAMADQWGAVE